MRVSNTVLFVGWVLFSAFSIEPWDSPYGWLAVTALGFVFGLVGNGNPALWPLGIFTGGVLFGLSLAGFGLTKAIKALNK